MLLLTREREARRWTRGELARRAKMTPADVGRIESGRLRPYPVQLKKLARALKVPAERLLEDVQGPGERQVPSEAAAAG